MTKERIRHLTQLAGVVAIPLLTVWGDQGTDVATKIVLSVTACLALWFDPAKRAEMRNVVLGVVVLTAPIVAFAVGHSSLGAKSGAVATVALAVLTKLPKALGPTVSVAPSERAKDAGYFCPCFWTVVALVVAVLLAGAALLWASRANAAESQFGGCFAGGALCAGPSAAVTVGEFNLSTQKFGGGLSPGLGYGLTWQPDRWYAVGLAGYLAFQVGGGQPNSATPAFMLSFANYLRLGIRYSIAEQDAGTARQASVIFGLGSDFGGSPTFAGRRP